MDKTEPALVSARMQALCATSELRDSDLAVPFEVRYQGRLCRAFAVRFEGQVYAYLNQCAHVPMEMDMLPNRFFDHSGQWLTCATHGAMYDPRTGACRGGPCRGGLVAIATSEHSGTVYWHTAAQLQPLEF